MTQSREALEKLLEVGMGEVRTSKAGVPHLVVHGNKSVCYFAKTGIYRVFEPYPASQQSRKDFKTVGRLVKYLQSR